MAPETVEVDTYATALAADLRDAEEHARRAATACASAAWGGGVAASAAAVGVGAALATGQAIIAIIACVVASAAILTLVVALVFLQEARAARDRLASENARLRVVAQAGPTGFVEAPVGGAREPGEASARPPRQKAMLN